MAWQCYPPSPTARSGGTSSDGRSRWSRSAFDLANRAVERPFASGGQLVELVVQRHEVPLQLVGGRRVLAPLHAELADELEDLDAALLDHEVVERLADHAEEGEQRERRAHDDPLAESVVEQRRVVLVDEPGELLVGEEQQHVVDGALLALVVVALGEVLDLGPHVAQERLEVLGTLGVGGRRRGSAGRQPAGT